MSSVVFFLSAIALSLASVEARELCVKNDIQVEVLDVFVESADRDGVHQPRPGVPVKIRFGKPDYIRPGKKNCWEITCDTCHANVRVQLRTGETRTFLGVDLREGNQIRVLLSEHAPL